MNLQLDQYVENIIADGYTVEKYKSVSNPCVNYALDFADKVLSEAQNNGFANVENLGIEIEGQWQFLTINNESVGFDAWVTALESLIAKRFENHLKITKQK